jgi:hypothetical protein
MEWEENTGSEGPGPWGRWWDLEGPCCEAWWEVGRERAAAEEEEGTLDEAEVDAELAAERTSNCRVKEIESSWCEVIM